VDTSLTPEEGFHSPSWPKGLVLLLLLLFLALSVQIIIPVNEMGWARDADSNPEALKP
jgi:hypothetical protein